MNLFCRMLLLTVPFVAFGIAGCGKPDPRDNPEFNEEAFKDPSAVKLQPMPKPKK